MTILKMRRFSQGGALMMSEQLLMLEQITKRVKTEITLAEKKQVLKLMIAGDMAMIKALKAMIDQAFLVSGIQRMKKGYTLPGQVHSSTKSLSIPNHPWSLIRKSMKTTASTDEGAWWYSLNQCGNDSTLAVVDNQLHFDVTRLSNHNQVTPSQKVILRKHSLLVSSAMLWISVLVIKLVQFDGATMSKQYTCRRRWSYRCNQSNEVWLRLQHGFVSEYGVWSNSQNSWWWFSVDSFDNYKTRRYQLWNHSSSVMGKSL